MPAASRNVVGRTIFSQRAQTVPWAAANDRAPSPCQGVPPSRSPEEEEEEEETKEEEGGRGKEEGSARTQAGAPTCWLPACWGPGATPACGAGLLKSARSKSSLGVSI